MSSLVPERTFISSYAVFLLLRWLLWQSKEEEKKNKNRTKWNGSGNKIHKNDFDFELITTQ